VASGLTLISNDSHNDNIAYDPATLSLFFLSGNSIKKIAASATSGTPIDFVTATAAAYFTIDDATGTLFFRQSSTELRKIATNAAPGVGTVVGTGLPSINPNGEGGGIRVIGSTVFVSSFSTIWTIPTTGGTATTRVSGLSDAQGMASDGTSLWLVNANTQNLFKYTINLATTGWAGSDVGVGASVSRGGVLLDTRSVYFVADFNTDFRKVPR
jgi:hypothetical protein